MTSTWIVPGAPLEGGAGWPVWYASAGGLNRPADPLVRRRGEPVDVVTAWTPFDPLADRRDAGVLTVRLARPEPGAPYDVTIPETGTTHRWRTLPDALAAPDSTREGVAFLFGSCFWLPDDREGAFATAVEGLVKDESVAFKLLIGDQLYADWPPLLGRDVRAAYAHRYEQYWSDDRYRAALASCPNFFLPDDHEYWNNFPERQAQVPVSRGDRRDAAIAATRLLFARYQGWANPGQASSYAFRVGPVSFFVSDSRSQRTLYADPDRAVFDEAQWEALDRWARELDGPGVLVMNQPLFQDHGSGADHSVADFEGDQERLLELLEGVVGGTTGAPHDVLLLSGDIHIGRHSVATLAGGGLVHEVVASPAARIRPNLGPLRPHGPPLQVPRRPPRPAWKVTGTLSDRAPTVDNNVGLVRMAPGTNERVRFTLSLFSVRAADEHPWRHALGLGRRPAGRVVPLLEREVQLR